ncbi:MAG: hypothetical protein ACT4PK_00785 [Gammaproteobacteria bacterium]
MESRHLFFAYVMGFALLTTYVALGIWAVRKAWVWTVLWKKWLRALVVSLFVTVIFAPGLMGAGHGVAFVPAWLMLATGTFGALTSESKQDYVLALVLCWVIVFGVTWLVTGRREDA